MFLGGVGILLLRYLRGDSIVPAQSESLMEARELLQEMAAARSELVAVQARSGSNSNAGTLSSTALDDLRESLAAEISLEVENRLSNEALAKVQLVEIRTVFANSYTRLTQALDQLNRRGNLNLVIGVITTVVAAGVLLYMAIGAPSFTTPIQLASHYIPRLSTVVFIEVFGFLRLYKATLSETKYYQTELIALANIDVALQAALKAGDVNALSLVVAQMVKGRNDVGSISAKAGEVDTKTVTDVVERVIKLAIESGKTKA